MIAIRILPSGLAVITERPWLTRHLPLLAQICSIRERAYYAVPDIRGDWYEIRDERADVPVSWQVRREIERAIAERRRMVG